MYETLSTLIFSFLFFCVKRALVPNTTHFLFVCASLARRYNNKISRYTHIKKTNNMKVAAAAAKKRRIVQQIKLEWEKGIEITLPMCSFITIRSMYVLFHGRKYAHLLE